MTPIFEGNGPVFEAANSAFRSLFEGHGMVARIVNGTRDSLVADRGMSGEDATGVVHATRNIFFDRLAAPGANPVTDPSVKAALWCFPYMAEYLVDVLGYGKPYFDQAAASAAGDRFRRYFAEESPTEEDFRSGRAFGYLGMKPSKVYADPDEYSAIPVDDQNTLDSYATRWHFNDWCITGKDSKWDKYTAYGDNRFYLLVKDGEDPASSKDNMSVVGITVGPDGKVVHAFDRGNDVVDREYAQALAEGLGLDSPRPTRSNLLELLNRWEKEPDDVADTVSYLDGGYIIVELDGGFTVLHDSNGSYSHVTDWARSIEPATDRRASDGLLVVDGKYLYALEAERILFTAPPGYTVATNALLDDGGSIVGLSRGESRGRAVNFGLAASREGAYLGEDFAAGIQGAMYCDSPLNTEQAVRYPGEDGYFRVDCDDGRTYAVPGPGIALGECPSCERPKVGFYGILKDGSAVVSRDGCMWIDSPSGDRPAAGPFKEVCGNGNPGELDVLTMDGKWETVSIHGEPGALTEGILGDFGRKVAKGTVMAAMCLGMLSHADAATKKADPGVRAKAAPSATVKKKVSNNGAVKVTKAQLQNIYASDAYNDRVTELLKELVKNNPGSNEQRLYNKACMRAMQEIVDGKLKLD